MRLFVAVDIDDGTRAQLEAARTAIQAVISEAPTPARVTWTRSEIAHVTVRFIGETPEHALTTIQEALATVTIAPFDVTWETVGTFGGTRHPRVIWVAPTIGLDALTRLAAHVNAQLDPVIGPGDARPFKPHLTLGRIREAGRGVEWPRALAGVRFTPSSTRVDHVTLYQSRLSPNGPTYTSLSTHG
jgi:2'-5' RNA ligase